MAKKGLGTGLGAIFGAAAENAVPNDFDYISISKLEPRADQPRVEFEQEAISELAASISEHGVLQPLTVRSIGGGLYQIIAGERRWRAARLAGLCEVPARIIVADDKKAAMLAMVENLQREDLNPIEEAQGYKALIDGFGLTQDEVAGSVSKSRPVVTNALRLLTLPEELRAKIVSRELSTGGARALLGLKDEGLILQAAEVVIQKKMNVREIEAYVRRLNSQRREKTQTPPVLSVNYLEDIRRGLTARLGRKVTITHGKKKGRIELEYYGEDDFESLCAFLTGKPEVHK